MVEKKANPEEVQTPKSEHTYLIPQGYAGVTYQLTTNVDLSKIMNNPFKSEEVKKAEINKALDNAIKNKEITSLSINTADGSETLVLNGRIDNANRLTYEAFVRKIKSGTLDLPEKTV